MQIVMSVRIICKKSPVKIIKENILVDVTLVEKKLRATKACHIHMMHN